MRFQGNFVTLGIEARASVLNVYLLGNNAIVYTFIKGTRETYLHRQIVEQGSLFNTPLLNTIHSFR